jgi:hypothetical protein
MTETDAIARIVLIGLLGLALGIGGLIYGHLTRDRSLPPAE